MEFTADYEKLHDGRAHWKEDSEHDAFNKRMRAERFSFEDVCKLCKFETILEPTDENRKALWRDARDCWERFVVAWNKIREQSDDDDEEELEEEKKEEEYGKEEKKPLTALGFVAVCYFFASLGDIFNRLGEAKLKQLFTLHEINVLNVVFCYNNDTSHPLLVKCGAKDPVAMPPIYPPAWQEWFDGQYCKFI